MSQVITSRVYTFAEKEPPNGARIIVWHGMVRPSSPIAGDWYDNNPQIFEGEEGVFWPDGHDPIARRWLDRWMEVPDTRR